MLINLTNDNFEQMVSGGIAVVDFWAPWCGPCRMLSPLIEEFATENPDIVIGKVNVDDYPDLAGQYGVMSIPTLLFFKNGNLVDTSIGVVSKMVIQNKVNGMK